MPTSTGVEAPTAGSGGADCFHIGVTRDTRRPDGRFFVDGALGVLDDAGLEWEFLPEDVIELTPAQIKPYDAILNFSRNGISEASLTGIERLALVARIGVGYDNVDVAACSARGVMVSITPEGVRRPMAAAAFGFVLALAFQLVAKDRITREGRWNDRFDYLGTGLTGRTLGIVGLGGIGSEIARLAAPFGMRVVASGPRLTAESAHKAGAEALELEELLGVSDTVVLCCPLSKETHHLIDETRLSLMKPTADLVNVSRGGVVDQVALTEALRERRIRSAALDVFEQEPIDQHDPILSLENVILAPHAIGHSEEIFTNIIGDACRSIVEVASGRIPRHLVNPTAAEHPLAVERRLRYLGSG